MSDGMEDRVGDNSAEAGEIAGETLPQACRRVRDAAAANGETIAIRVMPASTRTAEDAAAAVGCTTAQIVKSLIFRKGDAPVLFLVSGANRLNEKKVAAALKEKVARADADWVRQVTGFAIGGIPPFGHATPLETWIDETLLAHDQVFAAAGTPNSLFAIVPSRLAELSRARALDLA